MVFGPRTWLARLYLVSFRGLDQLCKLARALFVGFWLGILDKQQLDRIDQLYYNHESGYCSETYNRRGLWPWEQEMLERYFPPGARVLIASAGGGREVLALHRLGYQLDSFECNERLRTFANHFLRGEGLTTIVRAASRDSCPAGLGLYEAAVVGWGAYMLIQGRQQRIAFLRQLRAQLHADAPVLLSFFARSGDTSYLKLVALIGSSIRKLRGQKGLILGDTLEPNYVHYFTQNEIERELFEGGFALTYYGTAGYGHALGHALAE